MDLRKKLQSSDHTVTPEPSPETRLSVAVNGSSLQYHVPELYNMAKKSSPSITGSQTLSDASAAPEAARVSKRRSFLKGMGVAGAALSAGALLPKILYADDSAAAGITSGDAAILRFLAAAEIIETDIWQQYNELAGIQVNEVPGGSGNSLFTQAVQQLDGDMDQYIHDNTEDELSHEVF